MSYCLAVSVNEGLIFCSDSRTTQGVDRISTYSKMFRFGRDGQRQFVILAAGNLSTAQATMSRVKLDIRDQAAINLMNVATVQQAADYLGDLSLNEQCRHGERDGRQCTFIIGGQIAGSEHEVALVYAEGNHITTSTDTLFLQIGESKYGKPILDRILQPETTLETCALCSLVSMDSTMRSNLTVGPPVEVLVYRTNSLVLDGYQKLEADSAFLREIGRAWDERLKAAFHLMPSLNWIEPDQSLPIDKSITR
ncbi:MAG: peptidase [Gammaproteobacteria bacterium]|nr:peptidase [Pseudomonadales bacterium]MCP5347193.1 peptidase [Pseudomonadales bacterium]